MPDARTSSPSNPVFALAKYVYENIYRDARRRIGKGWHVSYSVMGTDVLHETGEVAMVLRLDACDGIGRESRYRTASVELHVPRLVVQQSVYDKEGLVDWLYPRLHQSWRYLFGRVFPTPTPKAWRLLDRRLVLTPRPRPRSRLRTKVAA